MTMLRASSGYSVQSGDATVITTGTLGSNDVPRFGRLTDAAPVALIVEHAATNREPDSRAFNAGSWGAGSNCTVTANHINGPDGTLVADRLNCTAASAFTPYFTDTTGAGDSAGAAWIRAESGTQPVSMQVGKTTTDFRFGDVGDTASGWRRFRGSYTNSGGNTFHTPGDYAPGLRTGPADCDYDLSQLETGLISTEAVPTSGGTGTRAAEHLSKDAVVAYLSMGRLSLWISLRPKGGVYDYAASPRVWTYDATTWCEIDKTTGIVTVSVAGAVRTLTPRLEFLPDQLVDLWIEAGGTTQPARGAYRIDGAPGVPMEPTDDAAQSAIPAVGPLDLLCNGTAAVFAARLQSITAYRSA